MDFLRQKNDFSEHSKSGGSGRLRRGSQDVTAFDKNWVKHGKWAWFDHVKWLSDIRMREVHVASINNKSHINNNTTKSHHNCVCRGDWHKLQRQRRRHSLNGQWNHWKSKTINTTNHMAFSKQIRNKEKKTTDYCWVGVGKVWSIFRCRHFRARSSGPICSNVIWPCKWNMSKFPSLWWVSFWNASLLSARNE